MAQYKDKEQYITGGTIDDSPEPVSKTLYDMIKPVGAAVESTGEYNLNVGGEGPTIADALTGLITPQYDIPLLSPLSKAIGGAAKKIDEILPDVPMDAVVGTATNPIIGAITRKFFPDATAPGAETAVNFTPGIGDPETGLYSPVDVVGLALDAAGIGLAGDYLKAARYRKSRELRPPDLGLEAIFERNQASLDAMRANPAHEIINPQSAVDQFDGLSGSNPVLTRIREIRESMPDITVRETVDMIQDDDAMMDIIRARGGASSDQMRMFDENLSARLEAEGIPAPPPGDLAATANRGLIFDEMGLDPSAPDFDHVMDGSFARVAERPIPNRETGLYSQDPEIVPEITPGIDRITSAADKAFGAAQKRIDGVNYTDFNINQINLFDEPGLSNNTVKKTFARQDRTDSYLDVVIESKSNGSMDVRMSDRASDTIKEDGYMHYNIRKLDDGTTHITDFHFFTEGEYLNLSQTQKRSAQRLFVDFMNTIPKGSKFTNNTLTLDSLHFIMRELVRSGKGTIKPLRKGVLGDLDTRTAASSKFSGATQLGASNQTEKLGLLFQNYQEQLIKSGQMSPNDIIDFQAITQRSYHKWGRTTAERAREKGTPYDHSVIKFTEFTIDDFKAFIPSVVGLKNWKEVEEMIKGKDETVDRVIDLEKGIF